VSRFVGSTFSFLEVKGSDSLALVGNNFRAAVIGGVTGGITSEFAGGSFRDGLRNGAFSAAIGYTTGQWLFDKGLKSFVNIAKSAGRALNVPKVLGHGFRAYVNDGFWNSHDYERSSWVNYIGDRGISGMIGAVNEAIQLPIYTALSVADSVVPGFQVNGNVFHFSKEGGWVYGNDMVNDINVAFGGRDDVQLQRK